MILMAQLTDEVYIISFDKHKMTIRLGFRLKAEIVRTFRPLERMPDVSKACFDVDWNIRCTISIMEMAYDMDG